MYGLVKSGTKSLDNSRDLCYNVSRKKGETYG